MSETPVLRESIPPVSAVFIFLGTAGILNGSLFTSPQPLTRLLLLPFAPLAAPPPLSFNSWHGDKKGEGMGESWKASGGRGGWWRNLEKESVSVAPTESDEGQLGEMGLLVRGCSWKVCRSH